MPPVSPRSQASVGWAVTHHGQPAGPERLDQLAGVGGHPGGQAVQGGDVADEHGRGRVPAAALGLQQGVDRGGVEGVAAHAVDGVGGDDDEGAAAHGGRRGGEPPLPVPGDGAVEGAAHGPHPRTPARARPAARAAQARRALVRRGRPVRSAWCATSVQPPARASTAATPVALRLAVLEGEQAARAQQPRGHLDADPQHAQPVRAAVQRGRRVVLGDLGVDRDGVVRDVRRVGGDDVAGAEEPRQQLRGRRPRRRAAAPAGRRRGPRRCGRPRRGRGGRARPRRPGRPGTSSSTASGTAPEPVHRSTSDRARRTPGERGDGEPGEQLGLRAGQEHAGPDGELDAAERRPAGEVLQRDAVGPLATPARRSGPPPRPASPSA